MGGGDLNMKKSWHPQTFNNIERVWKAEQRAISEKKKIEQLRKELEAERAREATRDHAESTGVVKKKEDRLDWMYQGSVGAQDREEFLLGKPVNQEVLQRGDEKDDALAAASSAQPGANFVSASAADAMNDFRDMSQKIRDDPMFAIKKREQEKLREIRDNPYKMKQLRKIMEQRKSGDKAKKSKKKKKKHKKGSGSDDEEAPRQDQTSPSRRDQPSESRSRPHRRSSRSRSRSTERRYRSSPGAESSAVRDRPSPSERKVSERADTRRDRGSPPRGMDRRRVSPERRPRPRSRSRSRSPRDYRRRYSPDRRYRRNYDDVRRRDDRRRRSPPRPRHSRPLRRSPTPEDDAEERERRLKQMMEDAEQHERDRSHRLEKIKKEEEAEEEKQASSRDAKFIQDMNKDAFQSKATANLEDRLKRNVHYIQKTAHSMQKFTSR